jgi:hypothetical protein
MQKKRDSKGDECFIGVRGCVCVIDHAIPPLPQDSRHTPQSLAAEYLHRMAPVYGFGPGLLKELSRPVDPRLSDAPVRLRFAGEKGARGVHVVMYAQTVLGIPIWEQGVAVTMYEDPLRVVASSSTIEKDIDVRAPQSEAPFLPGRLDPGRLRSLQANAYGWTLNGVTPRVYRYRAAHRVAETHKPGKRSRRRVPAPPTLPLERVPERILEGRYYVVSEVLFTLPLPDWGVLNWRAFVEVESGAVLFLRAFIDFLTVDAYVYEQDPPTRGWNYMPNAPVSQLDSVRQRVTLDVDASQNPAQVRLVGSPYFFLVDLRPPADRPPTINRNLWQNFDYSVDTPEFSAVNAYYHSQRFFALLNSWGFDPQTFFTSTQLPIAVDFSATIQGGAAKTVGTPGGVGTLSMFYGPIEGPPGPVNPVNVISACSWRIVLHEFGHVLLNECIHAGSFGFAHGPGDSMAAILCDPASLATDRYKLDPWDRWTTGARLDWDVSQGFGWGGKYDDKDVGSDLILCNTLFRAYGSMGGDYTPIGQNVGQNLFRRIRERNRWAEHLAFTIVRAIDSLPFATVVPTDTPEAFATALMNADRTMTNFRGVPGGLFHKLIRWSFELQGAYQPPNAPKPVVRRGAPPAVDVYLDDGRQGNYGWNGSGIWHNPAIWSRNAADNGTVHQEPVARSQAFAYVRVSNRGTATATGVSVSVFRHDYDLFASWPAGFVAATPAAILARSIPSGGSAIFGPFKYTSPYSADMLFAAVNASGDLANVSAGSNLPCATGPTPLEQLLRGDNNLGVRVLYPDPPPPGTFPPPGDTRRIVLPPLHNPFERNIIIELSMQLPKKLVQLGWRLDRKAETALRHEAAPGSTWAPSVQLRRGKLPGPEELRRTESVIAVDLHAFDPENRLLGTGAFRIDLVRRIRAEKDRVR